MARTGGLLCWVPRSIDSCSLLMLRSTDSINFCACLPAFLKTRTQRSSPSSLLKLSASLSKAFHFFSNTFLRSSSSWHAVGRTVTALVRKLDSVIGKKSREARSGCIRAKSASSLESSCGAASTGEVGETAEKTDSKVKRRLDLSPSLVGASSIIVSSSCTSMLAESSSLGSTAIARCRASSISNINLPRFSTSRPMSPKTWFHSSSHSIASST